MATAAFKSTTKRSSIGVAEITTTSSGRAEESQLSNRSGVNRRSRSLSRPPSRFPAFSESESGATGDNKHGRFVNTERGSSFADFNLEDLCNEFLSELAKEEETRERTEARSSGVGMREAETAKRRGRSISRQGRPAEAGATKGSAGSGIRRRSVSVARRQFSDSESDKDHSHTSFHHSKSVSSKSMKFEKRFSNKASPSTSILNYQCGLRRSLSQKDLPKFHDGQSAYSSALTDDEGQDTCSKNGEKTIRAVYSQRKPAHPDGDGIDEGLYEAMRKEVRQAVAEIRTELHQVMVKGKPIDLSGGDELALDDKDVIHAVSNIKKKFTSKLQQSEKRTQELLAELAVEEQRGRELSKIVRELVPNLGQSESAKHARPRKRSTDRTKMSNRLTEEAEKYFEDFLSNVEDTDFSSFDDERSDATLGDNMHSRDFVANSAHNIPLPIDADGVVLPWLQWETRNDGSSMLSAAKAETPLISKGQICDLAQEMSPEEKSSYSNSNQMASSRGSCSPKDVNDRILFTSLDSYNSGIDLSTVNLIDDASGSINSFDMDAYLQYPDLGFLIERVRQRRRISVGGLLLCLNSSF